MNIHQVKKYKKVIEWFCNNPEKGVWLHIEPTKEWKLTTDPEWSLFNTKYVINDEHEQLRKLQAEGRIIQHNLKASMYDRWESVDNCDFSSPGHYRAKPIHTEFFGCYVEASLSALAILNELGYAFSSTGKINNKVIVISGGHGALYYSDGRILGDHIELEVVKGQLVKKTAFCVGDWVRYGSSSVKVTQMDKREVLPECDCSDEPIKTVKDYITHTGMIFTENSKKARLWVPQEGELCVFWYEHDSYYVGRFKEAVAEETHPYKDDVAFSRTGWDNVAPLEMMEIINKAEQKKMEIK